MSPFTRYLPTSEQLSASSEASRVQHNKAGKYFWPILPLLLLWHPVLAQEMEPRAYSRSPVGTQFVLLSYAYQTGDVLFDSSLPLQDVSVKLGAGSVGYGRVFGIAGRQANISALVPYVNGTVRGTVFEERREVSRSGLGDVRLRFSTVLKGGPALSPSEFARYQPRTIIGVSLTVVAPTGQYDPARLVNIGSSRWAIKPEVGLSKPFGRWTTEVAGGIWFFTENKNFFGDSRRSQRPLASFQAHAIYTLKRRMWVSVNGTYYAGGRTVLNDVVNADAQKNSRVGATFSLPLNDRQSLKVVWAKGVTARFGGNLNTIGVAWQYAFF